MPGLQAGLDTIGGVAADSSGNVYISLKDYHVVVRLDAAGQLSRVAGTGLPGFGGDGGSATTAQLATPGTLALDAAGRLYIADLGNVRVRMVANGTISTVIDSSAFGPNQNIGIGLQNSSPAPFNITVASNGDIYIADTVDHQIRKSSGGVTTVIAGDGTMGYSGDNGPAISARLGYPSAVALGAGGDIFFVDRYAHTLRKISNGVITTVAGMPNKFGASCADGPAASTGLHAPLGLSVDANGDAYISDTSNNCVRKVSGGTITKIAGTGVSGFSGDGGAAVSAALAHPGPITAGANGALYFVDTWNLRVRKIAGGSINTVAGGSGWGDGGAASNGQLLQPSGVAVGPGGEVYIADPSHLAVRKVANGVITKFAGPGLAGINQPLNEDELFVPNGVAAGTDGAVYLTDTAYDVIRKISNGAMSYLPTDAVSYPLWSPNVARGWSAPAGIAVDSAGNVYVADAGLGMIGKITNKVIYQFAGSRSSSGDVTFGGDNGPATSALLYAPAGVATGASGDVYIADTYNSCIRKVSNGTITTVAGVGGARGAFSGDGGAATSAHLDAPFSVALDASGSLYIADTFNNRVRKVSNGIITTIAGGGTSFGDGGPATSAQLLMPTAIAVAADGKVYVSDAGNNRIRVLIPGGGSGSDPGSGGVTACSSVTLAPSQLSIGGTGGTLSIQVATQDQLCTWSVAGLPAWITAAPSTGTGTAAVALTVTPNSGGARSGGGTVSGASFTVQQSPAAAACAYALGAPLPDIPAAGTVTTLSIVTESGCAWSAGTAPAWINWVSAPAGTGNGSLSFAVAANTGAPRTATVQIAGRFAVTFRQHGATAGAAGIMGHFAAGAGWDTRFTLLNTGTLAAHVGLDFFDDSGQTLTPQVATATTVLQPGALLQSAAPAGTTESQTGWARLSTDGFAGGFGIFRLPVGNGYQEAVVPVESRSSSTYLLPFDNTDGYFYGVAISNLSAVDQVIDVTLRSAATGATVGTGQFPLAAGGHTQFLLTDRFPQTVGMTGTAEFRASGTPAGDISLLGLRFNSNHAFTSVPVFVHGTQTAGAPLANAGAMTHIAYGGGWSTLFTLVNTGAATAHAQLNFYGDDGQAISIPLSILHATSGTSSTASTFNRTIAPGAIVLVECSDPAALTGQTGWAQLSTDGGIGGSAVFRYTTNAVSQEAAVPLSTPDASDSILVFDNTGGYDNSVALANNSAVEADVPVTVRDGATGSTLATGTIELPALGHAAFMLRDRFPVTTGKAGSIEFGVSAGQVNVLGLRVNANHAFTSIPPIAKP